MLSNHFSNTTHLIARLSHNLVIWWTILRSRAWQQAPIPSFLSTISNTTCKSTNIRILVYISLYQSLYFSGSRSHDVYTNKTTVVFSVSFGIGRKLTNFFFSPKIKLVTNSCVFPTLQLFECSVSNQQRTYWNVEAVEKAVGNFIVKQQMLSRTGTIEGFFFLFFSLVLLSFTLVSFFFN